MYTNATARMYINGVLGKRFQVTSGVAQGCVLSPFLFTVYIDDLLVELRQSGLGPPVSALVQKTSPFAADLLLVSPNVDTTRQYLRIIEK